MKKFFAIAFVAASLVACNGGGDKTPAADTAAVKVDTAATAVVDTAAAILDTAAKKMDAVLDTAAKKIEELKK